MATWPPVLADLKLDMKVDDDRDDLRLTQVLDASIAFVVDHRGGQRIIDVNFAGLVNVNTASLTELQTLPGVDATIAQSIVDGRRYRTLSRLAVVVGTAVFDGIRDAVTLATDPDDDLVLGTLRLAGRWHTRRRSPDLLVDGGEMGTSRVPTIDADIDRLLRIGRRSAMAVA